MINQINTERPCHILTIEDPIEYVYEHKRATVNQREVGTDTHSFGDALRSALRADPDVLLVGEMRDLESIRFALTIAETGHLVFATLHTNDTAQALARIIDVFPAEQQAQVRTQLSAALTAIVYQRLIPRVGGGLVGAFEVLVANSAVRNLIKEGKTHQLRNSLMTGQREGMITLEQSLSALIQAGSGHLRRRGGAQPLPQGHRARAPAAGRGRMKRRKATRRRVRATRLRPSAGRRPTTASTRAAPGSARSSSTCSWSTPSRSSRSWPSPSTGSTSCSVSGWSSTA